MKWNSVVTWQHDTIEHGLKVTIVELLVFINIKQTVNELVREV